MKISNSVFILTRKIILKFAATFCLLELDENELSSVIENLCRSVESVKSSASCQICLPEQNYLRLLRYVAEAVVAAVHLLMTPLTRQKTKFLKDTFQHLVMD